MTIKEARLKDRHAVHPRKAKRLAMAPRALGVVLLFSLIAALSGLPTTPPDPTANTHEEHTLSTELQPPPVSEKEHHATVYIINLYAVKNSSSNMSDEMFENEVIETVPEILEPLATVLLVVDDDDEDDEEREKHSAADLDDFAEGLEDQGFKVDRIDRNGETKVLKLKLEKTEMQNMVESARKSDDEKKIRKKRTICLKCGGGGYGGYGGGYGRGGYGGGGYGGGYGSGQYPSPYRGGGGGGYPSGGGACPNCDGQGRRPVVVVVPISGGGHHKGGYPSGGGHYYPSGGGRPYYPSGGGGCYSCGGGGGGGGSYSQAQASAQASSSSGSWGKK